MSKKSKHSQGWFYRAFRAYAFFLNDCLMYKKVYRTGKKNIPPEGTPVLFVSNHQNCLCDPLSIIFSVRDRKINMFVRADIFAINPLITKFFKVLAMNPAFRLDFDGKEALWKNRGMFKQTEEKLLHGEPVMMYPEGRHQGKHWLGNFSTGYTKFAFESAELGDFQTDIWIQPCCNHYSSYRDMQQELIVEFGEPLSLQPFYDLYREKPRTAQRQVNEIIRKRVFDMMLHIPDLNNYKAIDFLRNTACGREYAANRGLNVDYLPDKLQSDKQLVQQLQEAMANDDSFTQAVYDDALTVERELKKLKIRDDHFEKSPGWLADCLPVVALIVLFPAWVFSLWPNIIIYKVPDIVMRRIKDKMFHNSFLYAGSVMLTMPLMYTLTFILVWIFMNFWVALAYGLTLPWLGLFAHYYWRWAVKTWQNWRFRFVAKTDAVGKLRILRDDLYERLRKIVCIEK